MKRGEGSPVRNLRRPRPLTLPLLLHDCGAAADLPGGRPRKPVASVPLPGVRALPLRPKRCGRDVVTRAVGKHAEGVDGERAPRLGGA